MKAEIKSKLSPLEKFTAGVIQKKFGTLAKNCEHQFHDSRGASNCAYHPSAVSYCKPELCPRLKSKNQMGEDARERKQ